MCDSPQDWECLCSACGYDPCRCHPYQRGRCAWCDRVVTKIADELHMLCRDCAATLASGGGTPCPDCGGMSVRGARCPDCRRGKWVCSAIEPKPFRIDECTYDELAHMRAEHWIGFPSSERSAIWSERQLREIDSELARRAEEAA